MTAPWLVLALDGATESCTTALLAAVPGGVGREPFEVVAARRQEASVVRGGQILLPLLEEALREVGAAQEEVAAVVVGAGPGTFTGVRVAVATARAIALALDIPVYGRSTLSALAAQALWEIQQAEQGLQAVVPVVDARRGQVFAGVYVRQGPAWVEAGSVVAVAPADVQATVRSLLAHRAVGERPEDVPGSVLVVGAPSLLDQITDPFGTARRRVLAVEAAGLVRGQSLLEDGHDLLRALAEAAGGGLRGTPRAGRPGSPEMVRPIYVRAPDADIHITRMKDPWA